MKKERIDVLLIDKGLAENKEMAKRYVMEGIVYIDNFRVLTVGEKVKINSNLYIKSKKKSDYVSRGGLKLEKAIEDFKLNLKDRVCMDIGASTGGFTDSMLRNGASKVYAVDVGYGQLDFKLRTNEKVVVMERTNIRDVDENTLEDKIDFFSIDVSFISLDLVLPVCKKIIGENGEIAALIKPQFEVERHEVEEGGVIRDENLHIKSVEKIVALSNSLGFVNKDLSFSPIRGATGNIEFLIHLTLHGESIVDSEYIREIVTKAHNTLY